MSRRTIRERVSLSGVGLHLGRECRLTFAPAPVNAGVRFRRTDLAGQPETPALVERAILSERRTQLGDGEGGLHTIEHVLAAIAGLELDDVLVEMDAAEPPILDGSARPFLEALQRAGTVEHGGRVRELRIKECVRVVDGESTYVAYPSDTLDLDVAISFAHPVIGEQRGRWTVTPATFAAELAGARTFGFMREVEMLRGRGLIQGASTANAVVLDDEGIVDNTLRWNDEFVRHKALDCVGDLALAGRRVRARIVATRPSHRGTVTLVRELLAHAHREEQVLGIEDIMKVLPHRYPFLLVDRILEIEENKRIVGIKNVTVNEPFFQGHFPGHPVMPGVLIVEAMAQVGGMLLMGSVDDPEKKVVYFMSLDNVKFRKPVRPGDQIRFEVEMLQVRGMVCRISGVAKVDGVVVCEGEMAAMVRDR
ncbi:MAG: bifunctional UDP-3-O-[3-hydroxymyristoyl] N-acetylglucosamine deacetylase/3-hydroxyacyl-ACP dehydratase [Gemmatimonadetes bacterium]|nr:bifunctional UDP-3-O-[3-hydroxymyristoyl] N-acetylglucosamine deacetylase/3-hydroxyacyl-ACP dehydratase [Gemmatimonadota bacterium]MBI3566885.1 bifunctional UDP-3-O-[3-hydroxymyristoyl] N-acetylglucosamine deacetylase/3-hydroxyacyl-ACP dehydratase [Gemmatimonadota bacterium]